VSLSLRLALKALYIEPFLLENLMLKIPYEFKKPYGGATEQQTAQDAPSLHGHPHKIYIEKDSGI
jgi:hypothetical protein